MRFGLVAEECTLGLVLPTAIQPADAESAKLHDLEVQVLDGRREQCRQVVVPLDGQDAWGAPYASAAARMAGRRCHRNRLAMAKKWEECCGVPATQTPGADTKASGAFKKELGRTADKIEDLLIEELRRLGNQTMQEWATCVHARVSAEMKNKASSYYFSKKR